MLFFAVACAYMLTYIMCAANLQVLYMYMVHSTSGSGKARSCHVAPKAG